MTALYTTARSANGRKALATVRHLGLDLEVHDVDVYAGEGQTDAYKRVHPLGKVPVLVEDGFTLTESNAILLYLDEVYGGTRLSSPDLRMRADITRWLFWEAAHWQPAVGRVLRAHAGHLLVPDRVPAPTEPPDWDDPALATCLRWLDRHLSGRDWICSDQVTLADLSIGGMAMVLGPCGYPFERAQSLAAWLGRLEALPAWAETAVAPW